MIGILSMSDLVSLDIIRLSDGFTQSSRIPMPILVRSESFWIVDTMMKTMQKE